MRNAEIEVALADLELALCRDRCHAVVTAPSGPGKTLLLHALAERLAGALRVVQLHTPMAHEDEIFSQILGQLGEDPQPDAEAKLLSVARGLASRDSALALLIGDAHSLQTATLRRLGKLALVSGPGLRLALFVAADDRIGRDAVAEVVSALGVGAEKVELYARKARGGDRVAPIPPGSTGLRREARGPSRRSASTGVRVPMPSGGSRAGRPTLRATLALGTSLVLVALLRLYAASAPDVASAGPPDVGGRSDAVRSEAPPTPQRAIVAIAAVGVHATTESEDIAPTEKVDATGSERTETRARSVGTATPAVEVPVRRIRVSLNARPWASIQVDDRDVGLTPIADLLLAPGPHRFRVRFPDDRLIERTVRVDEYRDHFSFP